MSVAERSLVLREMYEHSVEGLLKSEPILLKPVDSLEMAVDAMRETGRGCVLVIGGEQRLFGVFTERDAVIKLSGDDPSWRSWRLGDCMTPGPQTITKTTTIGEAIHKMNEGRFRHLPVLDEEGRAVGIVSIRDIMGLLVAHIEDEIQADTRPK